MSLTWAQGKLSSFKTDFKKRNESGVNTSSTIIISRSPFSFVQSKPKRDALSALPNAKASSLALPFGNRQR